MNAVKRRIDTNKLVEIIQCELQTKPYVFLGSLFDMQIYKISKIEKCVVNCTGKRWKEGCTRYCVFSNRGTDARCVAPECKWRLIE